MNPLIALKIIFILEIVLITQGVIIMAAIDNLNQAVTDLQTTINSLVVPVNNDAAIQTAADNIVAANAALKAKVA